MKVSGRGVCAAVCSLALLACAACAAAAGLRCVALGPRVRAHFGLGAAAAGAFYSGLLLALGQALLGAASLCCAGWTRASRATLLAGALVFALGVLTAFSGAVVDGDAAALVERKLTRHCAGAGQTAWCARLRDYQRALVASAVLNALECVLGLINLVAVRRYQAHRHHFHHHHHHHHLHQHHRSDLQPVSYINLVAYPGLDHSALGVEVQCGGHPSVELPGYAPTDPELNHTYPFSYPCTCPLPNELPPAYEDIYPGGSE